MKKKKVAFFDRDGTINVNFGYVYKPEDLVFIEGIPEIIKKYNDSNYIVVVVTNQAGIARGYYNIEDMHKFNNFMNEKLLKIYGAKIDFFYYCPHHPDFTGECICRKPNIGMFKRALDELDITLEDSVMYGDKESDRKAANIIGINKFIMVESNLNI